MSGEPHFPRAFWPVMNGGEPAVMAVPAVSVKMVAV